jgi:hypothetical protein
LIHLTPQNIKRLPIHQKAVDDKKFTHSKLRFIKKRIY